MGDVNQFTADLTKFGDLTEKVVGRITRAAALELFTDVVKGSPVDTGRFRSSWFVGIGTPNRTEGNTKEKKGEKEQAAAAATAESLARLAELTPETVTGREPVILSNNLPYGERLAAGSSQQAPDGWIDDAVARAAARINVVKVVS